jgi:hypothetical protein
MILVMIGDATTDVLKEVRVFTNVLLLSGYDRSPWKDIPQ